MSYEFFNIEIQIGDGTSDSFVCMSLVYEFFSLFHFPTFMEAFIISLFSNKPWAGHFTELDMLKAGRWCNH